MLGHTENFVDGSGTPGLAVGAVLRALLDLQQD